MASKTKDTPADEPLDRSGESSQLTAPPVTADYAAGETLTSEPDKDGRTVTQPDLKTVAAGSPEESAHNGPVTTSGKTKRVKLKTTSLGLWEPDGYKAPGAEFVTTPERVAELGERIEVLGDVEPDK